MSLDCCCVCQQNQLVAHVSKNLLISEKCLEDFSLSPVFRLLLCLSTEPVSRACLEELADFREMLIEDFSLSPEITHFCATEIKKMCQHEVKKKGGTLHCLMDKKDELSDDCMGTVCHSYIWLHFYYGLYDIYDNYMFLSVNKEGKFFKGFKF